MRVFCITRTDTPIAPPTPVVSSPPESPRKPKPLDATVHNYTVPAVKGFFHFISASRGNLLIQDTLRLLTLWFDFGHYDDMYKALVDGLKTIHIDLWLTMDESTLETFKNLQQNLSQCLDDPSVFHATRVKGANVVSKQERQQMEKQASDVMDSLFMFMEDNFPTYAKYCEKPVLKRLLKELWKMVLNSLEKVVVLPPLPVDFGSPSDTHNLNPRQCGVLEIVLDTVKVLHTFPIDDLKLNVDEYWMRWTRNDPGLVNVFLYNTKVCFKTHLTFTISIYTR
ncbi:protein unc-13 homolog B-like [Clytia hemisphaerica]|uniref:protein unc-13 homolog B-like n=1 Tax=Clytia hemisphaerica TaxID=252671 RepID=UPI0034D51897